MDNYREMAERICVPHGLNARVLAAAQENRKNSKNIRRELFRGAVCTACALVLVLGTVTLGESTGPAPERPVSMIEEPDRPRVLKYSFGIAAGAVENAANGGLVFRWEDGSGSFRIRGENIREIFLETSKGVLVKGAKKQGNCIREPFCADAVYRLAAAEGESVEVVDQAELLLEVTFIDGTVKAERYTLRAEQLRVFFNEDGQEVLVPALAGDDGESIPALYMDAAEGVWLEWPVADSRMVRLSMDYGLKKRLDGLGDLFHAGIDIPGENGLPISAAEAGIVAETGYDSQRGNYLVLDHGDGLTTVYAHCQEVLVNQGDMAAKGQEIARMGSTGMATGAHLHFEVRQNGEAQNPIAFFHGTVRDTLHAQ